MKSLTGTSLWLILLMGSVFAESTNQQLFRELLKTGLSENFSKIDLHSIHSINLRPVQSEDNINFLIEDEIFQFVQEYEISIFKDSVENEACVLEYQATSHLVSYKKTEKHLLERQVKLELFLRLLSPENEILFSDLTMRTKVDTVSQDISALEDKNIDYTMGNKKRNSIFEPIIVSVVTGVIVYIFYSYRSK